MLHKEMYAQYTHMLIILAVEDILVPLTANTFQSTNLARKAKGVTTLYDRQPQRSHFYFQSHYRVSNSISKSHSHSHSHLMDGRCLMMTSSACMDSKGIWRAIPWRASSNNLKLILPTYLMDTCTKQRSHVTVMCNPCDNHVQSM